MLGKIKRILQKIKNKATTRTTSTKTIRTTTTVKRAFASFMMCMYLTNTFAMIPKAHAEPTRTLLSSLRFKLDRYSSMFNTYKNYEQFPKQTIRMGYYILYRETALFLYDVCKEVKGDKDVSLDEATNYVLKSNEMADAMLFTGGAENTAYIKRFTGDNSIKDKDSYNIQNSLTTPSKTSPIRVINPSPQTYKEHEGVYNVLKNYFYPNKIFEGTVTSTSDQYCINCLDSLLRSSFSQLEKDIEGSSNTSVTSLTREYRPYIELYEEQLTLNKEFESILTSLGIKKTLSGFKYTKDKDGIIIQRYMDRYKQNTAINSSIVDIDSWLATHDVSSKQELSKLIDFTSEDAPLTSWYAYLLASTAIYRPLVSKAGDVEYLRTIGNRNKQLTEIYEKFGYKRKPLLQINGNQYSEILQNKCNTVDTKFVTLKSIRKAVLSNESHGYVVARTPYTDKGDITKSYKKVEEVKQDDKAKTKVKEDKKAEENNEEKKEDKKLESTDANAKDLVIFGDSALLGIKDNMSTNDEFIPQAEPFHKDSQDYKKMLEVLTNYTANMFVFALDVNRKFNDDKELEAYLEELKALANEAKAKGMKGSPTILILKPDKNTWWEKIGKAFIEIFSLDKVKTKEYSFEELGLNKGINKDTLKKAYDSLKSVNKNTNTEIQIKKEETTDVQDDYIKNNIEKSHYSNIVFTTGYWAENDWKTEPTIQYKFNSFNLLNFVLYNIFVNRTIPEEDLNSPLYMDFLGNIITQNNTILVPGISNYALYGVLTTRKVLQRGYDEINQFVLNRAFMCNYPKFADSKDTTSMLVNGDDKKYVLRTVKGKEGEHEKFVVSRLNGYKLSDYMGFITKYGESTTKNLTDIEKQAKEKFKRYDDEKWSLIDTEKTGTCMGLFSLYNGWLRVQHFNTKVAMGLDSTIDAISKQTDVRFAQDFNVGRIKCEGANDSSGTNVKSKSSDARKIFSIDGMNNLFLSNNRIDFNGKSFAFNNIDSPDLNGFLAESNYAYLTSNSEGKIEHTLLNGYSPAYLIKNVIIPAYFGISDCDVFFKSYLKNHNGKIEGSEEYKKIAGSIIQSEFSCIKNFKGILGFRDIYQNKLLGNMAKYFQAYMAILILFIMGYFLLKYIRERYTLITSLFMGVFTSMVIYFGISFIPAYLPELMNVFSNNLASEIGFNAMLFDTDRTVDYQKVYKGFSDDVPKPKADYPLTMYKYNNVQFDYTKDIYDISETDLGSPLVFKGTEMFASGDRIKANYTDVWKSVNLTGNFNSDNIYALSPKQVYPTVYDYYCPFKFILSGLSNTLNRYAQVAKPEYKTVLFDGQPKDLFLCNSFISSGVFIGYPQRNKDYEDRMKNAFKGYSTTYPLTDFLGLTNNFFKLYRNEKQLEAKPSSEVHSLWYKNMRDLYNENPDLFAKKIQQVNSATRIFMLNNRMNLSFVSDENFIKTVALYATITLDQQFSQMFKFLYPINIDYSELELGSILQVLLPDRNAVFTRDTSDIVDYVINNGGILGMLLFPIAIGLMGLNQIFMTWYYTIFIILLIVLITIKLIRLSDPSTTSKGFLKISLTLLILYYCNVIFYYLLYTWSPSLIVKLLCIGMFNSLIMFFLVIIAKAVLKNFYDLGNGQMMEQFKSSTGRLQASLEKRLDKLAQPVRSYKDRRDARKHKNDTSMNKYKNNNIDRYGLSRHNLEKEKGRYDYHERDHRPERYDNFDEGLNDYID